MNIFLRELRAYRKSTLIWALSLSALVVIFLIGMFPAFSQDIEASEKLIAQLPAAVRAAFSIQTATFFTIYGFYAYLLSFAAVAGAVQAMNLGTGILSKEVSGKTADFLLSKPITRPDVITSKLASALVAIIFTSAVFSAVSLVSAEVASQEPISRGNLLLMTVTFFLIQLFFLVTGALLAVLIPKVKSVIAVTLPTVFGFYIIGTLGEVLGKDEIRYLSPFKFYDTLYMAGTGRIEPRYLAVEFALVAGALVATYLIYLKKDIRAAA